MAKLGLICLALIVLIAATQVEVDGFRLKQVGTGLKKFIRNGIRFLFGRGQRPTSGQAADVAPVKDEELDNAQPIDLIEPAQNEDSFDPAQPINLAEPAKLTNAKEEEESPFQRTIIAIKQETIPGQYLYLRGGGPNGKPINIRHTIMPEDESSFYASTSVGDTKLDWDGSEAKQGKYDNRITPQGTPMMWTTNQEDYRLNVGQDGAGYYKINVESGHYWVVDIDMNCSQTTDGWFEFKGYLTKDGETPVNKGWEENFKPQPCKTSDGTVTFEGADPRNHYGRCGEFNMVRFNDGACYIYTLEEVEEWAEELHDGGNTEVEE